jgi:SAM-dependent methyltransferase
MLAPEDLKQLNRTMWSFGDYSQVADLLNDGACRLVDRLEVRDGVRHLDVATGNGNVALLSACRGAQVTGVDLTSEYFGSARQRASASGVAIDLLEADAEALPFADASFDLVTSTFGVQFAPRHAFSGGEMARVCRAGGTIGLCNWTAEGWTGRFQQIIASYFPSPPSYVDPPMLWGDEDYVRELFGDGFEVQTERQCLKYRFSTADALISFFETCFGPCIAARHAMSPPNRWRDLRAELVAMTEDLWIDDGPESRVEPEYLLVLARKLPNAAATSRVQ